MLTLKEDISRILSAGMEAKTDFRERFAQELAQAIEKAIQDKVSAAEVTGNCPSSGGPLAGGKVVFTSVE